MKIEEYGIKSNCIKADQTMTLALPKTGFKIQEAKKYIGELLLADISVPPVSYKKAFDIDLPYIFSEGDIANFACTLPFQGKGRGWVLKFYLSLVFNLKTLTLPACNNKLSI